MHATPGGIPLAPLLKATSRSFYLSLRFLPVATRRPAATAYLLARAADGIADTPRLPPPRRLEPLRRFRALLDDDGRPFPAAFPPEAVIEGQETPGERDLLRRLPEALAAFRSLEPEDRSLARDVLRTLTGGMVGDLERFPEAGGDPGALETTEDLDRYTYAVAGCVGEFWTRLHARHLPSLAACPLEDLVREGVALGKGLQLTNVLRDLPRDLRRGRCYLPRTDLARIGLAPGDLLDPAADPRLRPLLEDWLERALRSLEAGVRYLSLLPPDETRLRLTVWWPLALGVATLGRIRAAPNRLDPAILPKVPRRFVYGVMARSLLFGVSDRAVARRFDRLAREAGFPRS